MEFTEFSRYKSSHVDEFVYMLEYFNSKVALSTSEIIITASFLDDITV